MSEIASVSIARPLEEVAEELGKSFEEYGFAVIRDHGIPQELIDRAEAMSKAFFALPTETKKAYKIEGGGGGQGGVAVTKPVKIAGDINSASDFPVPPGGRQARFGTSVTVYMTVGTDGRASNCRVVRPSPDREADAIVCRLAEQRFRFRPATDSRGNPVPATYGWRQEWFAR